MTPGSLKRDKETQTSGVPRGLFGGNAPANVEKGEAAGVVSPKGNQRHEGTYHVHCDSVECVEGRSAGKYVGKFRSLCTSDEAISSRCWSTYYAASAI
jgi:hypothetical protein